MCRAELADLLLGAIRGMCAQLQSRRRVVRVDGMQSWPSAPLPALPGRGPELRLYDSSDRQVRPVAAGPTATMYVCGITPYDATHLGHAATYLAFDLIHRHLAGPRPRRALRAERHRRRRPAVRAGRPRRHRLARPRGPRGRAVPRGHGRAAGAAAARIRRGNRRGGRGRRAGGEDAGLRGRLRRRGRRVPRRLLPRRRHPAVRLRIRLRPRHHAAAVRRARRRPGPGRARPTRWTR